MADYISQIKLPNNTTYDLRDNSKLPKVTYEFNKEISFGSSGKLLIGKFPCYDSNVTIEINATTSTTYHAIAILATQNINTTGGGTFTWNTYGDSANTVTPNLFAKYVSGSNVIEIYFSPSSWSKNYIHIACVALRSAPTNICENVDSIPTEATRQPTNTLLSISTSGDSGTVNGHTVLSDVPANAVFTDTKSFTITANATDGYWDLTGTNGTNAVTYALAPYSSKQSGANFYTGTTNPDGTTRLNYNGYLYATKLYSNGTEVSVSGHNHNSSYLTAIGYDSTNKKIYYTKNGSNTDVVTFGSNAFDSTSYLPLAGGTMTGDIAFTSIGTSGTTGTSKKITWSGSTDNASIYYTVPSADAGRLVINTGDDTNCLVAWAYKDSIKAYINNSTPSFYPATTNTGSIGTSSVVWANIYATTFNGSILKLSNYMNSILTGAGTAAVTSGTKMPALWRFNLGIASPTEGDIVTIKIPVAGHENGVFVSLDNGTTYYPVSVSGTGALTTHYAKDQIITLVCVDSGGTNSIYPAQATINSNSYTLGTAANITGKHWCIVNYYDSGNTNTATRQKVRSTNGNYSLLFADPVVGTADNNTNYYTYRNDSIYVNPSTGNVYATTFNGALTGNATSATAANLTTTTNAIAYYTNTTGTFGSKASANGALYATSDNGTLSWGTLPIAQGGTGATTAQTAIKNLFTDSTVKVATGDFTDDTVMITSNNSGSTANWYQRTGLRMWNYIKSKADTTYAGINALAVANALVYKGVREGAATTNNNAYGALTPAANCGDTYKVSVAGFINGLRVEVGDMLICTTDDTAAATASNYTTIKNNWNIIQTSEGSVSTSSTSSTDNAIARWDGTSGRIIKSNSYTTLDDNGHISITHKAGSSQELKITYSTTIDYWWGVGTGDQNHGMWDAKAGQWIISAGSSNAWTFVGNVTGNVSGSSGSCTGLAAKATADANGNTITTYYCTLSTAQTLSGAKTFSAALVAQNNVTVGTTTAGSFGIAETDGAGRGISLYGGPKAAGSLEYGIMFAKTATFGKCGSVSGDWATYFTMNRNDNRGWIFKSNGGAANGNNNVASIAANGNIYTAGTLTVNDTTASTGITVGSIVTSGGIATGANSYLNKSVHIVGAAADNPLIVRGISGANLNGERGSTTAATDLGLYLNYNGGPVQIGQTETTVDANNKLIIAYGSDASSSVTGALTVAGGVGISKALYVGKGIYTANIGDTSTGTAAEAAMQIREYNYAGAGSNTWGVAPRLAWNWNGRKTAQIGLASNGYLYEAPNSGTTYYKLVYENGTWGINISGSANRATYFIVSRVAEDCKTTASAFPASNRAIIKEYTAGDSYNLPSNHWYHILSSQGNDVKYGTQLAIGMSTQRMYYRCYNNTTWGDWYRVLDSNNTAAGTNNNATLAWNTTYTIAKINGTDIKFTTMAKPSYNWSDIGSKPITFSSTAYGTTGWKQLGGKASSQSSIVVFKPTDSAAVTWGTISHSAVIAWGNGDTKGMIDCSYSSPLVSIAGGNAGGSTDAAPKWYFKLSATSGKTYTFPSDSKTLCASDGSNASGSWGISITGSANTATTLQTERKIWGRTFNGSADVTGDLDWDSDTYRQRIKVSDNSTANDDVFTFSQSTDSGSNYTTLLSIQDDGCVWAGSYAKNAAQTYEHDLGVRGGAGKIYFWSGAAVNGTRGIYLRNANESTSSTLMTVNQSNQITGFATIACKVNISYANTAVSTPMMQLIDNAAASVAASSKWMWGISHVVSNLAAGGNTCFITGKANGTNNSAVFGFHYADNNSDNNYADVSLYGNNGLFKVYKTGKVEITKNITSSSTTTGSLVVAGGTGIAGKTYIGDLLTVDRIKITNTNKIAHIDFSRSGIGNPNYINIPSNSQLIFSVGGADAANAKLVIDPTSIRSWLDNTVDIGTTSIQWKSVHAYKYSVEEHVTLQWNATDQSLDFIFA